MERKWLHFIFAVLGGLLFFLLVKGGTWGVAELWARLNKGRPSPMWETGVILAAALATILVIWACWQNDKIFNWISDCIVELQKVSWPNSRETFMASFVVVGMVVLVSAGLFVFDKLVGAVTKFLYL